MNKYGEFKQIITQRNILSNFQKNKFLTEFPLRFLACAPCEIFHQACNKEKLPELSGSFSWEMRFRFFRKRRISRR